jgi:glycosyltransferase involved in cell wall biosynthesis
MLGSSGGIMVEKIPEVQMGRTRSESLVLLLPSLAGGGAQRVATLLLPILADHFKLTLALLEDCRKYSLPEGLSPLCFSPELTSSFQHLMRIPYHVFALTRLVKRVNARLVLSFMEEANILNVLASRVTGHLAVLSQRIVPFMQHAGRGCLGRLILSVAKKLYPRAAHVITVSARIREIMVENFGLRLDQVTFIPNPVDLASLSRETTFLPASLVRPPYLLHIGRLRIAQKGQDTLVQAFSQLEKRWPALSLVLVGDGPDREELESLIRGLGLAERVILTGWQSDVASLMAKSEMVILPSRYEGWPNVLVEAMACGCPVVATDCESGPKEIIGNNEYGLLVPADDPKGLAQTIETLLASDTSREFWKERARKRAGEFSLERIGPKYIELIDNILKLNNASLISGHADGNIGLSSRGTTQ